VAAGGAWVLSIYRIFFQGPSYDDERTLWRCDGTPTGTVRVDVPSAAQSPSRPGRLAARSGGVVFDTGLLEIYRSDGTDTGTDRLEDPHGGELWSFDGAAPLPDGELVFTATHSTDGGGLYRTDGDFATRITSIGGSRLTRSGDLVYFLHDEPGTGEVWRTDGTVGGTTGLGGFERPGGLADVFGRAWFRASRGQIAWSLWESSGTPATTLEHPLDGVEFFDHRALAIVPLDPARGAFTFQADDGLYLFDPVAETATRFHALARFATGDDLAVLDGTLFIFDEEPDGSCTLWKSLGTAASTARVKTWSSGGCIAEQMAVLDGRLFFAACNLTAGCELWRSDGTDAGTVLVRDIDPGLFSSTPGWLTPVGDRLYFVACDAWTGCEPWASDGTAAGTHRVADIAPGPLSSVDPAYQSYEDTTTPNLTPWTRLVFLAADDGTGSELWAMPVEIFHDGFESGGTSRWSP
jgi:ELWxxDGT repeat protein